MIYNKITISTIFMIAIIVSFLTQSCRSSCEEIESSSNVDLEKYMGKWYEIARLENRFEKGKNYIYTIYSLNDEGEVEIVNSGIDKDGKLSQARAIAYAPNPEDLSKLRVSFFWPFYGDYYILELDEDYQWALVGSSRPDYLWILSRTPKLDEPDLNEILSLAVARNYPIDELVYPKQK